MIGRGRWHGEQLCAGLHYDIHVNEHDRNLGAHTSPDELVPLLELMQPDWVQTDCKGHPGITSWPSKTSGATVSSGIVRDALADWREATRRLGIPLHCHYSGLLDEAVVRRFPEWAAAPVPGNTVRTGNVCPRSPYVDELMIPQLLEVLDHYHADGFWVDGEIGPFRPCFCGRCQAAFRDDTGLAAPCSPEDHHWAEWMEFQRQSFYAYVTHYCEAVHRHAPGVLVCSNWLQTMHDPGEPKIPTDWLSCDLSYGINCLRCEARFMSTRGKPWDIMPWNFLFASGEDILAHHIIQWTPKPVAMQQQEAAIIIALGGHWQTCGYPSEARDGRLVPWRLKRLRQVRDFVKARWPLCVGADTLPQVAVLHSETHYWSQPACPFIWNHDISPVEGATLALLDNYYGVDVMDEWALLPKLADFALVVAPEQDRMSEKAVIALQEYVRGGGRLLLSGAAAYDRFGPEFLGVRAVNPPKERIFYVSAADGVFAVRSALWRLVEPTTAVGLGSLGNTPLTETELLPQPAASRHSLGKGAVVYVPWDLFRSCCQQQEPLRRAFVRQMVQALAPHFSVRVTAPPGGEVALRRQGRRTIVHLINLGGVPSVGQAVEHVYPLGIVQVELDLPAKPVRVELLPEAGELHPSSPGSPVTCHRDERRSGLRRVPQSLPELGQGLDLRSQGYSGVAGCPAASAVAQRAMADRCRGVLHWTWRPSAAGRRRGVLKAVVDMVEIHAALVVE